MRIALQTATAVAALVLSSATDAASRWVELRGHRFDVEVVSDNASRMRGLMFRDSLPAESGMLFVFESQQPLAFWMKNTLIPLDILYFDRDRKLVFAQVDTPPCKTTYCPAYPSPRPAQFVLELNAGTARKLGVEVGDRLRFDTDLD